ncbi:hypothetical protein TNIN_383231 [Trichonephila inaurata madagascariensis]|uniref:Uncharacterized protein n=1 Tax=Trichonephila inaurata madagascariensis TaxID=2747483 RepID=A0A8X6WWG8_9ARAC|nr:hypothetical protein TNIN_383231 [Trichonephila inaurata madagascariensis]
MVPSRGSGSIGPSLASFRSMPTAAKNGFIVSADVLLKADAIPEVESNGLSPCPKLFHRSSILKWNGLPIASVRIYVCIILSSFFLRRYLLNLSCLFWKWKYVGHGTSTI